MSGWVSVGDQLPQPGTPVLVVQRGGAMAVACVEGTEWFHCDLFLRARDVTHWMPLPEPPKE
jgi:hypothetical protein